MSKFFLLYLAPVAAIEHMMSQQPTPEQHKGGMDAWMKWMKDNEKALAVMGAPLGKTKRVTASGASETKNEVTGYSIVEAESHDAAVKLCKNHPHLMMVPGAYIDVMPVMPIPGM